MSPIFYFPFAIIANSYLETFVRDTYPALRWSSDGAVSGFLFFFVVGLGARSLHITQSEDPYGILLVFDTLLFGLTLSKTLSIRRSTGVSTPLVSLLMRDGIIYFLCA